jgi:mono/diheme cytochrome c family protein
MKNILVEKGNNKGKLLNFTAASGNTVYRGTNFPEKFYGISITPEPAGNLISARSIIEQEGTLNGKELFKQSELLASTDERFRPVNVYTAPDGSLYILDMYHGILQHKEFVTSYLRKQILSRSLDKENNNKGRIYRLRWTENELSKQPNLLTKTATELVNELSNPNGWWRDTARRLIIEKNDKSTATSIQNLIKTTTDHKVKINALWTLHGLDAISLESIKLGLSDEHTKVKVAAIAVSENLPASDKASLTTILSGIATSNYEVALQTAISIDHTNEAISFPVLKNILAKYQDKKHTIQAVISGLRNKTKLDAFKAFISSVPNQKFTSKIKTRNNPNATKSNFKKLKKGDQDAYKRGEAIFNGKAACFGCHGKDGLGIDNMGPTLSSSDWVTGNKERLIKVLLHGLSGPININGKTVKTTMIMPGMANNPSLSDEDLAAVSTYVRNNWGNTASPIKTIDIKKLRESTINQNIPYTEKDLK